MRQPALVRADHEHQFRARFTVNLRRQRDGIPVRVLRRVAVDVQNHPDGRILCKVFFDGLPYAFVCAVIIRVIIRLCVVQDRNARFRQNIRNFIAHTNDRIPLVQRPQRIRFRIFKARLHGIRFAGVRMYDQNCRTIFRNRKRRGPGQQRLLVRPVAARPGNGNCVRLVCGKHERRFDRLCLQL